MSRLRVWDVVYVLFLLIAIPTGIYHFASGRFANGMMAFGALAIGLAVFAIDWLRRASAAR